MAIVGGLDIHRRQITFDLLDTEGGQTHRGQLAPYTRVELRAWLARFAGQQADFAFEGDRLAVRGRGGHGAGFRAHLAEPADTRPCVAQSGGARPTEADHLRQLLLHGALPESWIPPGHIADARTQVRLRHALAGQRTAWQQRIHAVLFHHGLPDRSHLLTGAGRAGWLASSSPASRAARSTWPCA